MTALSAEGRPRNSEEESVEAHEFFQLLALRWAAEFFGRPFSFMAYPTGKASLTEGLISTAYFCFI